MKLFLILLLSCFSFLSFGYGWEQKADFGGVARHRTTALGIGNKAYFGLGHYNGAGINVIFDDWWEYDPATNAWTQKADYLGGLCYHAAGFSIDGFGYVGTGRNQLDQLVQDFYKYDPTNNTWIPIATFPGVGRRGAVSFVVNGYGYVGTGEISTGRTSSFYRYAPLTNTWTPIASFGGQDRTSAVAFNIGGYGYVGTGEIQGGASTKDFWRYNVGLNIWEQLADVGDSTRLEATAFAINGKGYIGTGADVSGGNNYKDIWEYKPITNTWSKIGEFEGTARRYLSSVTINNYAYCGLGTNGTNFNDFWRFDQTASLDDLNIETSVLAFPNPASELLNFKISGLVNLKESQYVLDIYSNDGTKVKSIIVTDELIQIDINEWTKGSYNYTFSHQGKSFKTAQIVIQ